MATSRILLISNTSDDGVATALETPTHSVTRVADPAAAIDLGGEPEVVVIDLEGSSMGVIEACRLIRSSVALATVPVLALGQTDDVEERIAFLETGVDDVIGRPFDPRELDARVEALALRYQRSRDFAGGHAGDAIIVDRDPRQRGIIAVYSPKGGVGTTTVAVNVAVSLAMRMPQRVAILDLDLQFGQVSTHLNMGTRLSIADLARDDVALRDPGVFQTYPDRHGSGLAVLAAPSTPDGAGDITEAIVQQILETAGRAYEFVVLDVGATLDGRSKAALARATEIVIVVTPEFPTLKAVHALNEFVTASGSHLAETSYVLNQIFAREILRPKDIEEALGTKIALTVPYDAFSFLKSVNEGVPVVIGAPRSAAAEQLSRLAARLTGVEVAGAPAERRAKGLGALFGRS